MKNICKASLGNECQTMRDTLKESQEQYCISGRLCHTQNKDHKCCKLCKIEAN